MSLYVSETKQIDRQGAWTFSGLEVDEAGACYAAERQGLRDIKPKGLVVRYPNPFAGGGAPEVLYESSDPFDFLWRSPSGDIHVLGKKHHFPVNGKFKTKSITQRVQRLTRIRGFGDRLVLSLGWPVAYMEVRGGEYQPIDIGLTELCEDIAGTGPDDIYVSSSEGIAHFDGTAWRRVARPARARFACVSRDEIYATGVEPEQGITFHVYRGNARSGFEGIVPAAERWSFDELAYAHDTVYLLKSGGEERGLYRVVGSTIEQLMRTTGYTGRFAGNRDVLWVANGIELLCFDGTTWKSVPRVWHDKSKA